MPATRSPQPTATANRSTAPTATRCTSTTISLPPVNAFWSLTMYDAESYLVANAINRYALGDRSGLTYDDDGSLTLYIQT